MRILHINCNYTGTTLHQLMIEKLDVLGIDNEVIVPTYDKSISVISVNDNVYVSECFYKFDRYVFDHKQSKIIKAIEEHYDMKSFDLIHAYTLFTDGNAARVLSEKYGIPYVVAVRNTDINSFFKKMIHLRSRGVMTMLAAKKIFFLSPAYKTAVLDRYVPEKYREEISEKSEIIPNGIDDFWFENKPQENGTPDKNEIRLVYVGRINKDKNIPTTQKAMKLLREQGMNVTLTVVGKVEDEKELALISKDPNTRVLAAMPKEKLIQVYRNSDIFVMPSFHETFGLVYAEAMSQGLPVIYTKGQGFDGQFEEGTVGYHVDAANCEDVAEKIHMILDHYEEIGRRCSECVKVFHWETLCRHYLEIYSDINKKER